MYVNFRNETVQLSKVYLNFTDAFKISWSEKILITNPCTLTRLLTVLCSSVWCSDIDESPWDDCYRDTKQAAP